MLNLNRPKNERRKEKEKTKKREGLKPASKIRVILPALPCHFLHLHNLKIFPF